MLGLSKKALIALSAGFIATTIAFDISYAALSKSSKKAAEAPVYQAQQFPLSGTDHMAVEVRYAKGKLSSLYFLNAGSNPVSVTALNQHTMIPVKGSYEMKVSPADQFIVTVSPYDTIMEHNMKAIMPQVDFYFVKAKDHDGYDLYSIATPAADKETDKGAAASGADKTATADKANQKKPS